MVNENDIYPRFPDLDPLQTSEWAISWGYRTAYLAWARDETHAGIVVTVDDDVERGVEDIFREVVPLADAASTAAEATDVAFAWLRETTGRYSKHGAQRARAFIRSVQEGATD